MKVKLRKRINPSVSTNRKLSVVDVLERVDNYRSTGTNQWQANCPAHPDKKPSLAISESDGRLLLYCHARCSYQTVLDALKSRVPLRKLELFASIPSTPTSTTEVMDLYDEVAETVIRQSMQNGKLIYVENDGLYKYSNFAHSYGRLPKEALAILIRDAVSIVGVLKRRLISVNEAFLKNVTLAIQSRLYRQNPSIQLNTERNILNLKNGLLDLDTMELSEHRDNFYSTIGFNLEFYDQEPNCPRWLYTLEEIFANDTPEVRKEKIKTLQQFFGLCLTADIRFQKILILIGHGANGKGVICSVLQALLGKENYSCLSMEHLASNFNISQLQGKLVNFCSELSSKGIVPDSILKQLSGEDPIYADIKFKTGITFKSFAKLIFSMNEIPVITDRSHAFYRRLIVLELNRIFTKEEQDPNLKEKLLLELNGIFLWALKGRAELLKQGRFLTSKKMEDAVMKFKRENNSVLAYAEEWLEVNLHLSTSQYVPVSKVYEVYKEWCEQNGANSFSQIKFGKHLTATFPSVEQVKGTDGQRVWKNLRFSKNCPPGLSAQFRGKL